MKLKISTSTIVILFILSCSTTPKLTKVNEKADDAFPFRAALDKIDKHFYNNDYDVYQIVKQDSTLESLTIQIIPHLRVFQPFKNDTINSSTESFNYKPIESPHNLYLIRVKKIVLSESFINTLSRFKMIDSTFVNYNPKVDALMDLETWPVTHVNENLVFDSFVLFKDGKYRYLKN